MKFQSSWPKERFLKHLFSINENLDLRKRWMPDSQQDKCSMCLESFGLLKRKHHCRSCGTIVCGQCSQHYLVLPQIGPKAVRVCSKCYINQQLETKSMMEKSAHSTLRQQASAAADTTSMSSHGVTAGKGSPVNQARSLETQSTGTAPSSLVSSPNPGGSSAFSSPDTEILHRKERDQYGFPTPVYRLAEDPEEKQRKWYQWEAYLKKHVLLEKNSTLKKMVRGGIPPGKNQQERERGWNSCSFSGGRWTNGESNSAEYKSRRE